MGVFDRVDFHAAVIARGAPACALFLLLLPLPSPQSLRFIGGYLYSDLRSAGSSDLIGQTPANEIHSIL